jgi:hypothetical protein
MLHTTKTAGNLYPSNCTHQSTMRPPAPTLEDLDRMVPTKDPMLSSSTIPLPPVPAPTERLVAHAIDAAQDLDLSVDQPYMPFEGGTTLREAYNFLRLNNYILIQGGRIDRLVGGEYRLTVWDGGAPQEIDCGDVGELLSLNYPDPHQRANEEHVTLPAPPMRPKPLPGPGLYAQVWYGTDIDLITDQEWQATRFPHGIAQMAMYVGDLVLKHSLWDVWWSIPCGCYIAQQVPPEELLARRTPTPEAP